MAEVESGSSQVTLEIPYEEYDRLIELGILHEDERIELIAQDHCSRREGDLLCSRIGDRDRPLP